MIKTNYHTHNDLCDGEGSIEDYIKSAVEKGFTALGFSSHAPLPVVNDWTLTEEKMAVYVAELEKQKARWSGRIQIYAGLEIDYIPGTMTPRDRRWTKLNLDFVAGSVHSTAGLEENPRYCCVDGPVEDLHWLIDNIHEGSFEALSESYYRRIAELVQIGGFSFLSHFDLIKKRNGSNAYFSEDQGWYRRQVGEALDRVAAAGVIMEINSGAISRGVLDEVYPSPWILAEAKKRDIPVMVNADAHRPRDIDCNFDESLALLRETGYRESWALLEGVWTSLPL